MLGLLLMLGAMGVSTLLTVIAVLSRRSWRRKDARRSPLHGRKLANLPGQQLTARLSELNDEILSAGMLMYLSFPIMLFAWALSRTRWDSIHLHRADWLFVIGAVSVFAFGLRKFVHHIDARNRVRDGLIAEQVTGQLLNRLIGPSCIVAHDLPCDGFNIDHIVIAPHAVYAVETKSFRKPRGSKDDTHYKVTFDGSWLKFPSWRVDAPILQSRRQAQWLAQYLRESLAQNIPVIPAVALPGWWIERTDAARLADVWVFTPMGRGADFMLSGNEALDAGTRALIAKAIALRYPQIEN